MSNTKMRFSICTVEKEKKKGKTPGLCEGRPQIEKKIEK